jgi:hypothetical protein
VLLFGLWQSSMSRGRVFKWSLVAVLILGLSTMLTYQSSRQWLPASPPLLVLGFVTFLNFLMPRHPAGKLIVDGEVTIPAPPTV